MNLGDAQCVDLPNCVRALRDCEIKTLNLAGSGFLQDEATLRALLMAQQADGLGATPLSTLGASLIRLMVTPAHLAMAKKIIQDDGRLYGKVICTIANTQSYQGPSAAAAL